MDILVNNAGIGTGLEDRKNFWEFFGELWDKIIVIDLNGVYYCSKPATKYMIEHGGGCIINVAYIIDIIPIRLQHAYIATKAAVIISIQWRLALKLAEKGVCVNVIAPSSVLNETLKEVFYSDKERT